MSFDWAITDAIPGSFTRVNAEAYYQYAVEMCQTRPYPTFVEVGVDQGRSASVVMQAIRDTGANAALMIFVDSWESVLIENKARVHALANSFNIRHVILHMTSLDAGTQVWANTVDMLLIDANHTEHHPDEDCRLWLPKLKPGGIACFHDFNSGFSAVDRAVDQWTGGWESLGDHDGLAIRKKP